MAKITRFFDRLEDKIRAALSKYPILYATIGGVALISFWRGVWEGSDLLQIHPLTSLIVGIVLMLGIGILVTNFLGARILLSGLTGKKKLEEKTIEEIQGEEVLLSELEEKVNHIEKILEEKK